MHKDSSAYISNRSNFQRVFVPVNFRYFNVIIGIHRWHNFAIHIPFMLKFTIHNNKFGMQIFGNSVAWEYGVTHRNTVIISCIIAQTKLSKIYIAERCIITYNIIKC